MADNRYRTLRTIVTDVRASRHVQHWILSGSNPIKIRCNLAGGVGATKNDELIVEASVGTWSVETICADLLGASQCNILTLHPIKLGCCVNEML